MRMHLTKMMNIKMESEIDALVSGSAMTAKDGAKWAETPTSEHQAGRRNIVRQRCEPNRNSNMM